MSFGLILLFSFYVLGTSKGYNYETKWFQVPVDHFSFTNNETFQIRYLINDTYWKRNGGPIFFYTGNEGDINLFSNNTGFMWEIAPEFKALVVFAEHRYYGRSLPFGNKSFSDPSKSGYLTSQQALADYVDLITYLRSNQTEKMKSPVFAFGGSYGGMLAAYIRMKYPHEVTGSIASSAPIWQFTGMTPCEAFSRIVTTVYKSENESCSNFIRKSWKEITDVTSNNDGLDWISKEWKICKPLKNSDDVKKLKDWLENVYINTAMANYPYENDFLAELPGYPVREICTYLQNDSLVGKELLTQLFKGFSVYLNYTGKTKCLDLDHNATPSLEDLGWDYQSCTEMVMPMCSNGETDMFEPAPWDLKKVSDECWKKFKVRPQADLVEKIYGGKRITAASNIVFANGLLDPWSSGGVLKTLSNSLISILIPEGAHHLDLRESNPADPASVKQTRKLYRKYITNWIRQYWREIGVEDIRILI